jgi:ABC-type glycerol-3-phosphate transport system substrate-binding protein
VYRESLFDTPPTSFEAVLDSEIPYTFPAAAQGSVNATTLVQYVAAGGRLADESGDPILDAEPLGDVLTFYAAAREAGVIDPALFQLIDPAETWASYRDGLSGLATVSSTLYLAERSQVRATTGLTWIPTPDGEPLTLASGWSWVVVTRDPERQASAMALINTLMNPVSQGVFTQAAGWLPSQQAALNVWGDNSRYAVFGDTLLNSARPMPDPALLAVVGPAIQGALEDVLLNDALPVQAASDAAQLVNPSPEGSP